MTKLILASASLGRKYLLDKLKLDYETIHTNLDEEKIIADNPINTILLRAKLKGEDALRRIVQSTNKPISQLSNKKTGDALILSADTEVILDGKLFGKPASENEAVKMLRALSGKTHEVVTGIYIIIISNIQFPISNKIPASPADRQNLNFKNKLMNPRIPFLQAELMVESNDLRRTRNYAEDNFKLDKLEVPEKIGIKGLRSSWSDFDSSRVTFRKLTEKDIKRYLKYTDYTKYTGGYALVASPQDFVTKVEGSISNIIGLPMEKVIPILQKHKFI